MVEVRYLTEQSLQREHAQPLLQYLLDHGADELTITVMALQDTLAPFADAFEDEMAPFERPIALRRVVRAGNGDASIRPVRRWSFDEQSLARLLSFLDDGLFHSPAGPDGWLEDLAIYRRGDLVLGLVSHEREGVLRLTPDEHRDVAALGIPSGRTGQSVDY